MVKSNVSRETILYGTSFGRSIFYAVRYANIKKSHIAVTLLLFGQWQAYKLNDLYAFVMNCFVAVCE